MQKTNSCEASPSFFQPSKELLEIQSMMPISHDDRENLKNDIKQSGVVRDPIKAYLGEDGDYHILGGLNRWQIASELNIILPVDVYQGTSAEYRALVINDNLNRRHLTTEQKQDIITMFLKDNPAESNRIIAQKAKTNHKTVAKIRKEKELTGEIPQLKKTIGKDGKERPAKLSKKELTGENLQLENSVGEIRPLTKKSKFEPAEIIELKLADQLWDLIKQYKKKSKDKMAPALVKETLTSVANDLKELLSY